MGAASRYFSSRKNIKPDPASVKAYESTPGERGRGRGKKDGGGERDDKEHELWREVPDAGKLGR